MIQKLIFDCQSRPNPNGHLQGFSTYPFYCLAMKANAWHSMPQGYFSVLVPCTAWIFTEVQTCSTPNNCVRSQKYLPSMKICILRSFHILFCIKFVWAFVVVHVSPLGQTVTSLCDLLINFVLICRGTLILCKSLWQNCQQRLKEWCCIAAVTGAVISSLAYIGAKAQLDRERTSPATSFVQHCVK